MSDRELLGLAAKAAGVELSMTFYPNGEVSFSTDEGFKPSSGIGGGIESKGWNPLDDDGDAFRLAVNLGISYGVGGDTGRPRVVWWQDCEKHVLDMPEDDPMMPPTRRLQWVRRAIVLAAAEIGQWKC